MFLKGIRTQLIVLTVLAIFAAVGLTVAKDEDASPYKPGSVADGMWQYCKQATGSTRDFAKCTCPIEQVFKDVPEALCWHSAVMKEEDLAARGEKEMKSPEAILEGMPKSCSAAQTEKTRKEYALIREDCRIRYMRKGEAL